MRLGLPTARSPPFSRETLWRYVGVAELAAKMPWVVREDALTVTHLTAVLALHPGQQQVLPRRAVDGAPARYAIARRTQPPVCQDICLDIRATSCYDLTMANKTLGRQLRQARERTGLSQEQWAVRLGVTARTVSRWEQDKSVPTGSTKQMIVNSVDAESVPLLAEMFGGTTRYDASRAGPEVLHVAEPAGPFEGYAYGHGGRTLAAAFRVDADARSRLLGLPYLNKRSRAVLARLLKLCMAEELSGEDVRSLGNALIVAGSFEAPTARDDRGRSPRPA